MHFALFLQEENFPTFRIMKWPNSGQKKVGTELHIIDIYIDYIPSASPKCDEE